jgi:hypothetical protein
MSSISENDKLVKEYKEAIKELKQALIIETDSRSQYNLMFLIDNAWEEKFNKKTPQEAHDLVSEQYKREGRYHYMKMPPGGNLPSVYDATQIVTKLQLHTIKLNEELKKKLDKQDPTGARYNNVNEAANKDLHSRYKDIKPIVLNSAGETMKHPVNATRLPALFEPPGRYKGGSVKYKKRHRRGARHTRHNKRKTKRHRKKKHRKSRR